MFVDDEWFTWRVVSELRRTEPETWRRIVAGVRSMAVRSTTEVAIPDNLAVVHLDNAETTADGLRTRRYFREGLGFGSVEERAVDESNPAGLWVLFPDKMGVGFDLDPAIIERDTEVARLIDFSTNFLLPYEVEAEV
ncbi:MAG TPA: hypothetical protein VLE74_02600 [Candidatus Saccharimonadales bacterium]|nr:hypothetical protein [Candidatus Saccharimonadales bacterium]